MSGNTGHGAVRCASWGMFVDGFAPPETAIGPAGDESHSRDAARDSMFLQATLRPLNGATAASFNVRVRNLSAGGMMAEADAAVAIDDPISVELRNIGHVGGKVAWVRGGRFGVTFDTTIDPKLARKPSRQDAVQPVITGSGYHRASHLLG